MFTCVWFFPLFFLFVRLISHTHTHAHTNMPECGVCTEVGLLFYIAHQILHKQIVCDCFQFIMSFFRWSALNPTETIRLKLKRFMCRLCAYNKLSAQKHYTQKKIIICKSEVSWSRHLHISFYIHREKIIQAAIINCNILMGAWLIGHNKTSKFRREESGAVETIQGSICGFLPLTRDNLVDFNGLFFWEKDKTFKFEI